MTGALERLTIRSATPADAAAIVAGIEAICAEGGAFYVSRFVPSPRWEQVLHHPEDAPECLLAVVEWEREFVGAGRLFPGAGHTLFRHVGELGMFVLPPHRNQGVGTTLLDWMIGWAIGTKLEKVTLSVFETNEIALHLYRKFGFVEEGCLRRQLKVEGRYVDLVLMARFLEREERPERQWNTDDAAFSDFRR